MIYFGVENNIKPEIGKKYAFICDGKLHIGECIPSHTSYHWAMKDLNDGKTYYPYCSEVLDIEQPLMSALWERSNKLFNMGKLE